MSHPADASACRTDRNVARSAARAAACFGVCAAVSLATGIAVAQSEPGAPAPSSVFPKRIPSHGILSERVRSRLEERARSRALDEGLPVTQAAGAGEEVASDDPPPPEDVEEHELDDPEDQGRGGGAGGQWAGGPGLSPQPRPGDA